MMPICAPITRLALLFNMNTACKSDMISFWKSIGVKARLSSDPDDLEVKDADAM